ncbi:hypothetical protein GS399_16405 [Pedobacter sp. HMF7647]|uniref:Ankyrin repeat domain-containing protein n=1 Tax=Hufsiella arboris TaxID=2695275 RepID=A0A7K1YEV1_9SPHI|nr:ankyrin repeat domain-containing protein [Hufsiella arboris]MXV52558.1 hypothetical protein [Hufsiella arboris]
MSLDLLEDYIESGNVEGLKTLLDEQPALASSQTSHNVSPLLLSCYYKKPEISQLILNYVQEPDFYEAAAVGKFDSVANYVFNTPELINTYSEDGFTPLGFAAYFGHEDIARYLLLKGADVNMPSQNGFQVFPIHSAVAANNIDITKILLEAGADVNVAQRSGATPLHAAAQHGNIEILILLLEAGANISVHMEDGRTPADMAFEKGFKDIAKILTE